ncbi:uncharacterized protein F4817DRAFT_338864 [Daldinia loculata]|uniref:uncharacterized protein n=1 Tax=Daldinia loculata TaxID=103429 RepID=UPI0020C224F4|nr:uncharacterized protein F4817DRAFT_338864 [Daldinia loculata]KAI1646928.1 hypothetical protein F4817DRAFT_338864 [Daldinia loculata]
MKIFIFLLALSACIVAAPHQRRFQAEEPTAYRLDCHSPNTTRWCETNYHAGCNGNGTLHTDNVLYCGTRVCKCVR